MWRKAAKEKILTLYDVGTIFGLIWVSLTCWSRHGHICPKYSLSCFCSPYSTQESASYWCTCLSSSSCTFFRRVWLSFPLVSTSYVTRCSAQAESRSIVSAFKSSLEKSGFFLCGNWFGNHSILFFSKGLMKSMSNRSVYSAKIISIKINCLLGWA